MIWDLIKWLLGKDESKPSDSNSSSKTKASGPKDSKSPTRAKKQEHSGKTSGRKAPRDLHDTVPQKTALPSPPTPQSPPVTKTVAPRQTPKPAPIDLAIGLDLGTCCTKAVIGDPEANRQTAVPINSGRGIRAYLLPTRVYVTAGVYTLDPTPESETRRNLKMRILDPTINGREPDVSALCDLAAFTSLSIRRVLDWYSKNLATSHPNRLPFWSLNVGLPSLGGSKDRFAPIYRKVIRAAAAMTSSDSPVTLQLATDLITDGAPDVGWLPDARINTFPEAGAQLASLILSPHRPMGCLLVIDIGAGTMDISTLRIGGDATSARCVFHECSVEPLGTHPLLLARKGKWMARKSMEEAIPDIPEDDGVRSIAAIGSLTDPPEFTRECRNAILPVVARYRRRLRNAHNRPTFEPWAEGLPFVLSGGGNRDPFFQGVMNHRLEEWLQTVVSEWAPTVPARPHAGMQQRKFPTPRSFAPSSLLDDFDRFSVAHGLSLGIDGLMEMKTAS